MFGRRTLLATMGLACFGLPYWASPARAAAKVKLIAFSGANVWPVFVAQEKKLFDSHGIDVELTFTPGSQFQMVGLIEGKFDIGLTGMDNVVAYDEGQGAVPIRENPDLVAFMGYSDGMLHLIAAPGIKTYQDLKGKRVGVDAPSTGYAFVLRRMLESQGIGWNDVEIVEAGGVKNRFDALMKKQIDATLVVSPLEVIAAKAGFIQIGSAMSVLGAYQGDVSTARRDWMRKNPGLVVGYLKAFQLAMNWLYDPTNRSEALDILGRALPAFQGPAGIAAYGILMDRQTGFSPDLMISREGVAAVLQLRSAYAQEQRQFTDPSKYIDLSYYLESRR